jgi:hypothetical protein
MATFSCLARLKSFFFSAKERLRGELIYSMTSLKLQVHEPPMDMHVEELLNTLEDLLKRDGMVPPKRLCQGVERTAAKFTRARGDGFRLEKDDAPVALTGYVVTTGHRIVSQDSHVPVVVYVDSVVSTGVGILMHRAYPPSTVMEPMVVSGHVIDEPAHRCKFPLFLICQIWSEALVVQECFIY